MDRQNARWSMVLAGAALIGVCYGFARFAYGLFAPEFEETFSFSSSLSGLIASGSYVGYCVAILASLLLTQRLGPRRVALTAGGVATLGIAMVALAPSAQVLAIGLLVAGLSTGIASPPLADAVAVWVVEDRQNRAQTIVNAGTGFGVLLSGPIALLLLDQWRVAWATFGLISIGVVLWVASAIPSHRSSRQQVARASETDADARPSVPAMAGLITASLLMGVSSIAMWTFGRSLLVSEGDAGPGTSTLVWMLLGAAGIAGAMGGDLVDRMGVRVAWAGTCLVMSLATAGYAFASSSLIAVIVGALAFGASYICLTGVALVWATILYPHSAARGVGVAFLAIAAGQAAGAPLAGLVMEMADPSAAFYGCAAVGLVCSFTAMAAPRSRTKTEVSA